MEENEKRLKTPYQFENPMKRWELFCALGYLVFHVSLLPLIIAWLQPISPEWLGQDAVLIEFVYAGVGVIFMLTVMLGYLRRAFYALCDNFLGAALSLMLAYMLYLMISWAAQFGLMALGDPLEGTSPNNELIGELVGINYNRMFAVAVFMTPIVEEVIFRGGLFGGLYKLGRVPAYVITVLLFSLVHTWQYAVLYEDWTYLLYTITYIPPSVALCYAYEKSGSIWTPIALHAIINAMGLYVLKG